MTEVNIVAVIVAALAGVAIGAGWFGPWFGKQWMHLVGLTKESMKNMKMKPQVAMALGFIVTLFTAYVFAHVLRAFNFYSLEEGLTGALWVWIGFFVPVTFGSHIWEGKPIKLFFITGGYFLVQLLAMAAILTLWP